MRGSSGKGRTSVQWNRQLMINKDCPNFDSCNAAVCPLDPRWRSAVHLPGEKVCTYALASGKPGAAEHYADSVAFRHVLPVVQELCDRFPDIATRVKAAARQGI